MKKNLLATILTVSMVSALTACGSANTTNTNTGAESTTPSVNVETTVESESAVESTVENTVAGIQYLGNSIIYYGEDGMPTIDMEKYNPIKGKGQYFGVLPACVEGSKQVPIVAYALGVNGHDYTNPDEYVAAMEKAINTNRYGETGFKKDGDLNVKFVIEKTDKELFGCPVYRSGLYIESTTENYESQFSRSNLPSATFALVPMADGTYAAEDGTFALFSIMYDFEDVDGAVLDENVPHGYGLKVNMELINAYVNDGYDYLNATFTR